VLLLSTFAAALCSRVWQLTLVCQLDTAGRPCYQLGFEADASPPLDNMTSIQILAYGYSAMNCFSQQYACSLFWPETVTMALITSQCQVANAYMYRSPYLQLTMPVRARVQQPAYTTVHSSSIQQQHFHLFPQARHHDRQDGGGAGYADEQDGGRLRGRKG
jgi:hypothetical protein